MSTTYRNVYGYGWYRQASANLRARVHDDGTLTISRRAYEAAAKRCTYAGTDSMTIADLDGYTPWSEASGTYHGAKADGKSLERGTWYCRPVQ